MKLVIVDDDILLCSALSRNLIRSGHAARRATSVETALRLIESENPSAVLTDLEMGPGGTGIELIVRLRAAGSSVPVLMMTGSDPKTARERLRAAELHEIAILEKPFEFEELMTRLASVFPEVSALQPSVSPGSQAPRTPMAAMMNVVRSFGGRVM